MTNVLRVAAATILLTYLSNPAFGQSTDEKNRRGEWRESLATNPLPKQGCFQSSYPNRKWREVPCVAAPNYPQQAAQQAGQVLSAEELKRREDWRINIAQVAVPKRGCFTTSYPNNQWREVACVDAPDYPQFPKHGPRPMTVGKGNDVSPQAPSGTISTAIGSFDSVSAGITESGKINNTGSDITNAYTLQLNTNFFTSSVCMGSADPSVCKGWEQFIFANDGANGKIFIQYWIIKYGNACPAGQNWNQRMLFGSIYCFKNSTKATAIPNQPVSNFGSLSLSGNATATSDQVTLSNGNQAWARSGENVVGASAGWQIAEFNVVGNAGSGQANFNNGASLTVRTRIFYGGRDAPICTGQGFTGETNNLSFGTPAPTASQPGPAVQFVQNTAGGAAGSCGSAVTVGDTHLQTFNGVFYDFQASGDFLLAQRGPDFVVHTRQVSGKPTWPDASVNSAVATRMGKTAVAICLPGRVLVDGKAVDLGERGVLSPVEGVDVTRIGNVYWIVNEAGDSVKATVHATWIDVSVGLGRWPDTVTGLLANVNGNVNQIATRDGAVLTNPFPSSDLYGRYADSWRVPANESLLNACSAREIERGIPSRVFYANDLPRDTYDRTRAVCTTAGVRNPALLDACTLDVAVIGDNTAAQVFVAGLEPAAVGTIISTNTGGEGTKKYLVIAVVVILALILLFFLLKRKTV
jgi:hypothetical protein